MKATHDRVIVQPISPLTETAAGIRIPALKPDGPREALVISVGRGRLKDNGEYAPLSVKPGDHVLIHEHMGAEFQNEDGTFLAIRDNEILAVIDAENPTQH